MELSSSKRKYVAVLAAQEYLDKQRAERNISKQAQHKKYNKKYKEKNVHNLYDDAKNYLVGCKGIESAASAVSDEYAVNDWSGDNGDGENTASQSLAEWDDLVKQAKEILTQGKRRPTYIESSKGNWDYIRDQVKETFTMGMSTRIHPLDQRFEKLHPCCPQCHTEDLTRWMDPKQVKVLSLSGVTEEDIYPLNCGSCLWSSWSTPTDIISIALWPVDTTFSVYIDFNLMFFMSVLQYNSPPLSLGSLLASLKFMPSVNGTNTFHMKQDCFNYTFSEWRRQERTYFANLVGEKLFTCPACGDAPHAVHIDGNMKLYRYSKQSRDRSKVLRITCLEEEASDLFVPTSEVENVSQRLSYHPENQVDNTCGATVWKAATTKGRLHAKKDETGCMFATCRHCFILKALDMKRGEIYAYPYTIQKRFPEASFIALDTMCQYWGWLKRVDEPQSLIHKPFLSIVHAKSHQWKCQVSWSGRCREGVGLSTGETTELTNSYMSRLGSVTRNMESTGRRRRLEDAAAFWNLRKTVDLPAQIKKSMVRAHTQLPIMEDRVKEHCERLKMKLDDLRTAAKALVEIGAGLTDKEGQIQEVACCLQRIKTQILKTADTSKKRDQWRKRYSNKLAKFKKLAESYASDHPDITIESITKAIDTMMFPWSGRSCALSLSPELLHAVEDLHLLDRTREEIPILERERDNLLRTWVCRYRSSNKAEMTFLQSLIDSCRLFFNEELQDVESMWEDVEEYSDLYDCDTSDEELG